MGLENISPASNLASFWGSLYPIPSMYGIFAYIYHKNQPNVGKHTVHGSYWYAKFWECVSFFGAWVFADPCGRMTWRKTFDVDHLDFSNEHWKGCVCFGRKLYVWNWCSQKTLAAVYLCARWSMFVRSSSCWKHIRSWGRQSRSLSHADYIGLFGLYFLPAAKLIDAMENTMFNTNPNCILYRLIFSKDPFSIAMLIHCLYQRLLVATRWPEVMKLPILGKEILNKATLWHSWVIE